MSDAQILEGIQKVAQEHLDFEGDIALETPLAEALELDSIRMLTLVVELENHFEVILEEDDESGIETVGDQASVMAVMHMNIGDSSITGTSGDRWRFGSHL